MKTSLVRNGLFCVLFIVAGSVANDVNAAEYPDRPNIVLLMADDMGLGDTSAYQDFTGNRDQDQLLTPSMERLARMGMRFTDAHAPASRCTPTRYALLTGRYAWRNRLKHWVLFGAQGDPMIEADRPTLATLMRGQGYRTGMVGKWHVGLRYTQSDGRPAAGWQDADLTKMLHDTPLDHGFDLCWYTSRSHGTSGATQRTGRNANGPSQSVGPGHLHGRVAISAEGTGKRLVEDHPNAYVLKELGGRHSGNAINFLSEHLEGGSNENRPFFLYYASNSNHSPYTPEDQIGEQAVAGASRSVSGDPMDVRSDFIYENDVALGRLIDFLAKSRDPRRPGKKLIDNTVVIFTSDNGAERAAKTATGPFRSHKGSVYEGGHRVPLIVAWQAGGVGDGDPSTSGRTSDQLVGLQDLFASFAEIVGVALPNLRNGETGAEDSVSFLTAMRGGTLGSRPMFFHDHSEAKDHAASAIRIDDPLVDGRVQSGKWKLFFDASLLRAGRAVPVELFDLARDPQERENRIADPSLQTLVGELTRLAIQHRTSGGHRLAEFAADDRVVFDWQSGAENSIPDHAGDLHRVKVGEKFSSASSAGIEVSTEVAGSRIVMQVSAARGSGPIDDQVFHVNGRGLGVEGGRFAQVDDGEAILVRFDRDVIVESAAIVAGNGSCGGFYRVGKRAPLAIYCVDGDIDAQDQSGILSDVGLLRKGESLRLDSSPHFGVETPGQWRLGNLIVRPLSSER